VYRLAIQPNRKDRATPRAAVLDEKRNAARTSDDRMALALAGHAALAGSRAESGRSVAVLIRIVGQVDLAESDPRAQLLFGVERPARR
jgi:hypothetical protein